MPKRNYFLKMVGAADWPLENRWIDHRPDLLYAVRAPRRPQAIRSNDLLVYYSAVTQKLFAIARASQDGANVAITPGVGEERWPYLIPVQMYLAIPTLQLAPSWTVLGIPSASVQQKSYIEITRPQYEIALDAITVRAREAQ